MTETLFWISVLLLLYPYIGYPAILYVIFPLKHVPVRRGVTHPAVSLIITAYNEERRIQEKIENSLRLDYPPDKVEIIVASDGSTDATNEIVSGYRHEGIILVAPAEHKGKENAQREAIKIARGEVVVFSDVGTTLEKDGLIKVVSNFCDPTVGCVSSEDKILTKNREPAGEEVYVKYEMLLRRLESGVHSLVGLSGSFFAVRRELVVDLPTDEDSDFVTVFAAIKKGYRAVSDPRAVGFYEAVPSQGREFHRKVRTVLRGIAGIANHLAVLNIFRYGFFSFQVLSHKILRWLMPLFAVCVLVSNVFLITDKKLYVMLLIGQVTFYAAALLGLSVGALNRALLFRIPAFLVMVNASIVVAWYKFLCGQRALRWEPSRR